MEMSGGKLALRAVLAVIFGAIAFVIFYYVPSSLGSYITRFAGSNGGSSASSIVGALINPVLPIIGLAVALLVFIGTLLRGTKAYGPVLIFLGLVLVAYVYTAFQGGTINLTIPKGVGYSASGNIAIDFTLLMYLFLLAPILTLLKGVVLTMMKPIDPRFPA